MRTLNNFLLVLLLLILQIFCMPNAHVIRPDSEAWASLFYSSWWAFTMLSLWHCFFPELGLSRFLWKGSFLLYFGTVGSTVVKAPGITIILTVTSLPLLLVRLWLSRHEKTEKAGER